MTSSHPSRLFGVVLLLTLTLGLLTPIHVHGTPCTLGQWYDSSSGNCTDCGLGYYSNKVGATAITDCRLCGPGTYNDLPAAGSCQLCGAGEVTESVGSLTCKPCPAGTYANLPLGAFICTDCPLGTYGPYSGVFDLANCTACPTDLPNTLKTGATDFAQCVPTYCAGGNYTIDPKNTPVAQQCMDPCDLGHSCLGGVRTDCIQGSYADQPGQTSCTLCTAGKFSDEDAAESASACKPCPIGTFNSGDGSNSCQLCADSETTLATGSNDINLCIPAPGYTLSKILNTTITNFSSIAVLPYGGSTPIKVSQFIDGGSQWYNWAIIAFNKTVNRKKSKCSPNDPTSDACANSKTFVNGLFRPTSRTASLRLSAFGTDDTLTAGKATLPSPGNTSASTAYDPTQPAVPTDTTKILLIVFLCVGFIPIIAYKYVPAKVADLADLYNWSHESHRHQPKLNQPTQLGAMFTWAWLWLSILVATTMFGDNNTQRVSSLVPPAGATLNTDGRALGNFELTLKVYLGATRVAEWCPGVIANPESIVVASGFGGVTPYSVKANNGTAGSQSCNIAVDCLQCSVTDNAGFLFTLPYDAQVTEYEVYVSAGQPNSFARSYGVISQLPGYLLDTTVSIAYSVIESFYKDDRDQTTNSGYEIDFSSLTSYTDTAVGVSANTLDTNNPISVDFSFKRSSILYETLVSRKQSLTQLVSTVFATIVSLISLFGAVFTIIEFFIMPPLKLGAGRVITDPNDPTKLAIDPTPITDPEAHLRAEAESKHESKRKKSKEPTTVEPKSIELAETVSVAPVDTNESGHVVGIHLGEANPSSPSAETV